MNSIYKKLKTIKFEIIIVSIALFVLGLLLVIFPTASQEIICKGIGVALCVWGVLRLINYFRIAGSEILGSYGLVQGVTLLAFGMFFVIKPGFIAVFLGTALAIIIIVDGILKLQYAVDFYHLESDKWWIELIGAVVMVVIGIIALLNPFSTSSALIVFIGIALMIEGLWDFISLMRIVSVTKKAGKAIKNFKDKKRKEAIDARNDADSFVFQTQQALDQVGANLDANDKAEVEADLNAVKSFLDAHQNAEEMTDADVAELKAAQEKLTQSAQKVFAKMYEQTQAAQGAQGAGPDMGNMGGAQTNNAGAADDDVVDADFKEV